MGVPCEQGTGASGERRQFHVIATFCPTVMRTPHANILTVYLMASVRMAVKLQIALCVELAWCVVTTLFR